MMENQQLIKKDRSANSYSKIFPWTFTDLVLDRVTKESLDNILVRNNFIALPYVGSKAATRLQVPMKNRRRGIWLSYIDYAGTLTVEYYNDNNLDDNHWQDSSYWLPYNTAEFQPASVGLSALAQEVFDWINSQITTAVKLNPEDLQKNSSGQIEEANRAYDTSTFSGLGYRILRKNIQSNKNILTQSMINMPNTIYEIRYDFDLNGNTINIPDNCELKFVGGSLKNGIINGNIINNYIKPEWFGAKGDGITDDTKAIQMAIDFAVTNCRKVVLSNKTYNISSSIIIPDKFELCTNKKGGDRLLSTVNIVQTNVGSDIIIIKPTSTQPNNINIHDIYLSINGGTPSTNGNGISLDIDIVNYSSALQSSIFENIAITNCRYGIYIHTIGYVGIMWNIFRSLNLYRNVIGFYLNGEVDATANRANWFNHNTFVDCHITQNQIGGIYATSRQIETLNITRCNIQECGRHYTATDYTTFGVNAIKLVGLAFGESKIDGCYFERNYPFTTERITDDQLEIGGNFYPPNIGSNLLVNDIHVTNITTIITGNHFALINPAVTISGNVNLQMFHNEINIETVTITDNKYIARVNALSSLGNYSCVTINEPERFNISGSSSIIDVININPNYINLKYDINVPVFGATYKIIDGVKYEGNVNAYIDNQNAADTGSGLSVYNKAKLFNKVLNANKSVLPNSVVKFILNDIYEDRNYVAANNTTLNNAKVIIESTQTDKKWNIGAGFFQIVNSDLVINNINFDFYSTTISAIYFRLYGATNIIFNNCTFTGKSSPSNFTLVGCYGTNSTGSVTFNNCTFDKGTAVNSDIRLVRYISGINNIKVVYNSCTFIGNFSSDGINSDGTLLSKERIVSSISQITLPNIIYKIIFDIDLGGTTLTLPANCTLDFQGGSFSNGTIVGNCKITGNVSNIFGDNLILFSTSNSNLQVIDSNQCKILANNSFISLSKRELLKVDDITSLFDIGVITASSHLITEYISNGYLKYDTTKIVITDNNGLIATTYDSAISYNVWDVTMLPITTGLTLDYIKPQMFSFANYSDKVTAAINYAQCYNLKVDIIEAFTLSKSIIISRSCYLNFNNKTITYSGTTALDAMIILCPINNQTASGSININNLTLNGNSLVDASILVLGLSKSKIDNLFSLNCSKAIYLHAITAIIYNQINGLKSYNVDYAIYSIPYFEDKNPANSFINGNLYQFGNTGSCNINAGFFNYGNGNTIAGGDSEPLGKKYCFVFNSERATLRDIMWLESDRNIRAINNSIITISGDIFSINGLNCDDSSIIESGEFDYTGYSYNQLQKLPQDRVFNLDSYIRFSTFNNKVYGYDLKNNNFINSNMTLSADTVSLIDDVFVRYGGCWLPINSLEGKSIMFTINHRGTFSDYNMQDIIGVIQGNSLVLPSDENTNTFLFRLGFKDFRQYDYLLPILSEYRTNANIGTEQKGVIKVILYFEKDASGNLVMYYSNTNVIVCPQAVYSTVSGNLFFFIQTNKYNYTLKDIAIFSKQLSTTEFYNVSKVLDNAVNHCPRYLSGTTANRPTLYTNQYGFQYYDTTLGKLILWSGTAWTNLDGSALT